MDRTTIMLPADLKGRISKKAGEMRVSLGEFLRLAAETYLDRDERKWTEDPLLRTDYIIQAPAPANVSERVDEYLYGARKKKRS